MTIKSLIDKVKEEKPNTFSNEKLVSFINEIEADVAEELHVEFEPYSAATDMNTELLAEKPYDRLYVSYVKAMIDYSNEEYASYQLNQEQHELDFSVFLNWIVRTGVVEENIIPSRFRNIF